MSGPSQLVFLEGRYVRLRTLTREDVRDSPWVGWFNSEFLCQYNKHHFFPVTFDSQIEFLQRTQQGDSIVLGIEAISLDHNLCGVVALSSIDLLHRNAEIAGMQDERQTRRFPQIFLESWSLMLRHGFTQLGLRKIYGGSFRPGAADALRRAFNFEIEGIARDQVYKSGQFHAVTRVAVFNDTIRYPDV